MLYVKLTQKSSKGVLQDIYFDDVVTIMKTNRGGEGLEIRVLRPGTKGKAIQYYDGVEFKEYEIAKVEISTESFR